MKKLLNILKPMLSEQISRRVLYVLAALTAVLFVLFFLVDFNRPFDDDPSFNAPLFTDALLVWMCVLVVASVALALWSAVRAIRMHRGENKVVDGIPAAKVAWSVAIATGSLLVFTLLFSSSACIVINGAAYTDTFWLRLSDMFINTSIILIVLAVAAVIFGTTRYSRRKETKK